MSSTLFFAAAVAAGLLLLASVAWSTLHPRPGQRASVTSLLGILGFALVASPNWTSISIKSNGLELSLIRELQARQLAILSELRGGVDPPAAPKRAAPPAEVGPGHPPTVPREESEPAPQPENLPAGDPRALARIAMASVPAERVQHLLEAFDRGELALSGLSDGELMALSDQISARRGGREP